MTADIAYYDAILEWSWLTHKNSDCDWLRVKWFYRDSKKLTFKDFQKESAECQIYTVCILQTLIISKTDEVLLASMQVSEIILSEEYSEYTDVFSEKEMS